MRIHSKLPLLTALVIAAFTLSFMGVQAQENSLATVADSLNGKIETVKWIDENKRSIPETDRKYEFRATTLLRDAEKLKTMFVGKDM